MREQLEANQVIDVCRKMEFVSIENSRVSFFYEVTNGKSEILIVSKIVGSFYLHEDVNEKKFKNKGEVLACIKILGIDYFIQLETAGVVKKIYPQNSGIIDYGCPLFLIAIWGW
ncbi:hypothetical protein CMALT430_70062 [Carnobacterium maltaromaticum]|uniref:hypothetical protein n=1 Tax=Carnobacterium maltaromaticum TaxID=2751 RepID=UPI00191BBC81|nr:hypothetical protein [Carnobacterium maltaromaticum]CAD5901759.1 hypothetical protein CMALT430_70062 [Carnobacterium maltaromaticum]